MKANSTHREYPDLFSHPSAHIFGKSWDPIAVTRIIRLNSGNGQSPAFLYLGRYEAELLKQHLADAFGDECVTTLHDTYYMGLKVIIVDAQKYISTGGHKKIMTIQAPDFSRAS